MDMQCCVAPIPVIRQPLKRGITAGTYFPLTQIDLPDAIHCGRLALLSLSIKKHIKESDVIKAVSSRLDPPLVKRNKSHLVD